MIKIRLREIMWDKFITAKRLSKDTGISTSTISEIIHGKRKNIELDTINTLCNYLNCMPCDLLQYIPDIN